MVECKLSRIKTYYIKYVHLDNLRLTNTNQDKELYNKACTEFNEYCKARKTQYHTGKLDSLFDISKSTDLWKKFKNTNAKSRDKVGNIQNGLVIFLIYRVKMKMD